MLIEGYNVVNIKTTVKSTLAKVLSGAELGSSAVSLAGVVVETDIDTVVVKLEAVSFDAITVTFDAIVVSFDALVVSFDAITDTFGAIVVSFEFEADTVETESAEAPVVSQLQLLMLNKRIMDKIDKNFFLNILYG